MKRFSAFIISLFVAVLAFAQGSVTVTQSSAITDIVNNGGKPAKQTPVTPQKQTTTTPQKQQSSATPQTQQTTPKQSNSSESGNASPSSSESGSSSESSESKHDAPKPHVYSKQPAKPQQKIDPNMTDEEKLAEHIQERSVDFSGKGKKVMMGAHKVKGYRIQIFNGGNKGVDKKKAQEWAAKLKKQFPNMPVYVHFLTPRWMTMCGNYRTHKEAEPIKKKLIEAGFKYASIVRQQIVIE